MKTKLDRNGFEFAIELGLQSVESSIDLGGLRFVQADHFSFKGI